MPARTKGERLDVRTLCLIRETLARHDGLADFAFAMQGLGTGAVTLFGTRTSSAAGSSDPRGQRHRRLRADRAASGSDVAATATTARRVHGGCVLNGEKT